MNPTATTSVVAKPWRRAARAIPLLLSSLLLVPVVAHAALVGPGDSASPANFTLDPVTAPGNYVFGHAIAGKQSPQAGQPGFSDYWQFSVSEPAVANGWVSSLGMGAYLDIEGLGIRLVQWSGDGAAITPTALMPLTSALTTDIGGNRYSFAGLTPVSLAPGQSYALYVQGTAVGTAGGAYSGGLNLVPAPLPGGLVLMLSGLPVLGLAGQGLRRRRNSRRTGQGQ